MLTLLRPDVLYESAQWLSLNDDKGIRSGWVLGRRRAPGLQMQTEQKAVGRLFQLFVAALERPDFQQVSDSLDVIFGVCLDISSCYRDIALRVLHQGALHHVPQGLRAFEPLEGTLGRQSQSQLGALPHEWSVVTKVIRGLSVATSSSCILAVADKPATLLLPITCCLGFHPDVEGLGDVVRTHRRPSNPARRYRRASAP